MSELARWGFIVSDLRPSHHNFLDLVRVIKCNVATKSLTLLLSGLIGGCASSTLPDVQIGGFWDVHDIYGSDLLLVDAATTLSTLVVTSDYWLTRI